jgi:hypothetical protein
MKKRFLGLMSAVAVAVCVAWLAPMPAAGQAGGKGNYKAPRTNHKTPDLQGIWQAWNTAQYSLEWHGAATGIRAGKSFIVDPADGMIPYRPEARQKQQQNFKNRVEADPMNSCYMTGVPRFVTSGYSFQVFQTPKYIILASEFTHMLRYIYMDRKTHTYDGVDFWNGDSIGRWEGDTLVVDTANNNDQTWLDASGNHHSNQLKVVERFTRTGPDTLRYEATLTDPGTYTRPFTVRMDLNRNTDQYAQLLEYECHVYKEEDEGRAAGQVDSQ